ncbi:helix-turn-helix domain-containing protein [Halomonas alkaliantarctica]|uniref:Helix-turn-helix domain-containing protein n=1 Tax=Halomonas alkaliantarctica TaxID=232346 RepID=A0ABY8LGR1_9GAMM|nr:helix-turn-helix domain-containing protein [Halomonas alkaliantarctica]WGI23655.1 helix-turn-helix domain-containing protein [Halomonas alkaliantarctica]
MTEERAFRGVWIPAEIWLNRELSLQEKVMLIEIDSLQHPQKGCFKSNKKLAEFFGLSPNRVSEVISSLKKKGWIRVDQVREGKQIVERRIFMKHPLEKPNRGTRKTEQGYSENRENPIRDSEGGYSENGENPIRDPEEGYSENREERGSGLGVQLEGSSKRVAPGASPAAATGDYLGAEEPQAEQAGPQESADDLLARIPSDMPGTRDPTAKTFKPWANYACAYRARYGTWPVWNQKVGANMSQLVDRVGAERAPGVAAHYVKLNNQYYTARMHPVGLLLQDCEAIATQLATGQQVTQARARQLDSTQSNLSNAEEAKRIMAARRQQQESSSC